MGLIRRYMKYPCMRHMKGSSEQVAGSSKQVIVMASSYLLTATRYLLHRSILPLEQSAEVYLCLDILRVYFQRPMEKPDCIFSIP